MPFLIYNFLLSTNVNQLYHILFVRNQSSTKRTVTKVRYWVLLGTRSTGWPLFSVWLVFLDWVEYYGYILSFLLLGTRTGMYLLVQVVTSGLRFGM